MIDILAGYFMFTLLLSAMFMFISNFEYGLQWINPVVIYKNIPVNWFGCIILTILAHIAAGPIWVSLYWFYKLCTVGRKRED